MRLLFERGVPNSEAFSFPQHALHLHRAGMCADTRQKSEEKTALFHRKQMSLEFLLVLCAKYSAFTTKVVQLSFFNE